MFNNFQLEFGLWRNGELEGGLYYNTVQVIPGSYFSVNIPSRKMGAQAFVFRGDVTSEVVDDWFAFNAGLFHTDGSPISTIRPGMAYVKPCDIPTTVLFPSLADRPLYLCGIWVVGIRAVGSIDHERSRWEARQDG